jgi:hypothetical protein
MKPIAAFSKTGDWMAGRNVVMSGEKRDMKMGRRLYKNKWSFGVAQSQNTP